MDNSLKRQQKADIGQAFALMHGMRPIPRTLNAKTQLDSKFLQLADALQEIDAQEEINIDHQINMDSDLSINEKIKMGIRAANHLLKKTFKIEKRIQQIEEFYMKELWNGQQEILSNLE
ncbi:hypothetical protein SS50377_25101 [Spironucleus salmonicida]|uniref:Uncharacterized protein n=1 Tax=Spironucleus salmonicida TaxID=348837 RepID=V6LLX9_9EUKA|nr:hypothetical protein SS50377_25101 [Spironucleus salmonicida]|eukprot:EST44716.1 Hypothetical protein SS50377_15429 [Spironucleus salmonicida]